MATKTRSGSKAKKNGDVSIAVFGLSLEVI
jgi:hypothetical protein